MRFAWFFVVPLLFVARAASANSAAPYSRPVGATAGVVVERRSAVEVAREDLFIDCVGTPDRTQPFVHPTCTFVATYFLENPSGEEEELLGAFYTAGKKAAYGQEQPHVPIRAELDGKDVRADPSGEQIARMDEIVKRDPEIRARTTGEDALNLYRDGFQIVVPAGARAKLVFRGELEAIDSFDAHREGYAMPAIVARHPFVTSYDDRSFGGSDDEWLYLVSPLGDWPGNPEVHVTVRHLAANEFLPSSPSSWSKTANPDRTIDERVVVRAREGNNVRFKLRYRPFPLKIGGPLVGIGPRIAREELRVRFGYEVGVFDYAIFGAIAETNFDEYVTAVPTLEVASPCVIILPSLGIGGGMPIQLRKDEKTRVGGRVVLTMSWPVLSILFPIDIYPVPNGSGSHVEGSFITQLSF